MRKPIEKLGYTLFIIGFGFFLISQFLGEYKVDEATLAKVAGDNEKSRMLIEAFEPGTYRFSFGLISDLDKAIEQVNDSQNLTYSFSDSDLEKLSVTLLNEKKVVDFNLAEDFFGDREKDQFRENALKDYGGWLEGQTFESSADLKERLREVNKNIISYEINSKKGFDRYEQKSLRYDIARASSTNPVNKRPGLFLMLTYGLCIIGALLIFLPRLKTEHPGIKNNGIFHRSMTNRGWLGIITGSFLILFYIVLYFAPEHMVNWVIMVDPISHWIKGSEAGQFFLYGYIYTLAILVMGVRMIIKYRHSKYQIIRTISVMFFQTAFAFLIPEILIRLNKPYHDFKNIWPLDYSFFFDTRINEMIESGTLGIFMLGWGTALIIIAVPVLVYFFGKRWYCSWVCGCGGLAETLGDPYRQLSDRSLGAWKVERWMVHGVLVLAVVMTAGVLYTYWTGSSEILGVSSYGLREWYGAWIGAGFAGVVGTGFYPLMGNRVWCRFGCPLAAYLGIVQRFKSRFRITTNGGQCISCGNCSVYCEMGIDVRWYAQRGQNIIRASCVGCGICSSVCPRGVLNLENRDEEGRFNKPILIGNDSITLEK